jgi:hypothetical protein
MTEKFVFGMCPNRHSAGGGGTKFVNYFSEKLVGRCSFQFMFDSVPDYVLMFDPRHLDFSGNWLSVDVLKDLKARNFNCKYIHRINDIGYPKNRPEEYVNGVIEMGNLADKVIYVSEGVKDYYKDNISTEGVVIPNGVDERIFRIRDYSFDKFKLVTHHWSSDPMKGKALYDYIDSKIPEWGNVEFTYIGNVPKGSQFKNTKVLSPLAPDELAVELRNHNVYVSGSQHEPCGMHKLEGVASGLPIIYNEDSGDSYLTSSYGIGYQQEKDFDTCLKVMEQKHRSFYNKIEEDFDLFLDTQTDKYLDFIIK